MIERRSPYRFLDAYGDGDAEIFFARDQEIEILLADVIVSRLVVLFARTGTGKTSLINAGVRPRLERRGYETFYARVRRDPEESAREALRAALAKRHPDVRLKEGLGLGRQLEALSQEIGGRVDPEDTFSGIVLFLDQFEEFFLYVMQEQPDRGHQFMAEIARVEARPEAGVHIVLSLREDFFVELDAFRDVIPRIFHQESNLRLRWFDRPQARRAVLRPAAACGIRVERELVRRLVGDLAELGKRSGAAPTVRHLIEPAQLQIVCDTLWRDLSDGALTLARYLALGDPGQPGSVAEQVISQRLREELGRVESKEQLALLEAVLSKLHTPRGTKWVRVVDDLREETGADPAVLDVVLGTLEEARLLRRVPRDGLEHVELTHDYLVERLEELQRAIRTTWPRRVLERGLADFERDGAVLSTESLQEVAENLEELPLRPREAELVLRSALADETADATAIVQAVAGHRPALWHIARELIERGGHEVELVVRTLVELGDPSGIRVIQDALDAPERVAGRVVATLGDVATLRAVEVLSTALRQSRLQPLAEAALARIARLGAPDVASGAVALLTGRELAEGAQEELIAAAASQHASIVARVLPLLGRVEQPTAVVLLTQARTRDTLASEAGRALRMLASSSREDVALAAAAVLPPVPYPSATDPRRELPSLPPPASERVAPTTKPPLDESHYGAVADALLRGRLAFVLGAGVNHLDGNPRDSVSLPTGAELARDLAKDFGYPAGEDLDLLRVSQYVTTLLGEGLVYEELHERMTARVRPTTVHRFIAGLPKLVNPVPGRRILVVTLNYDQLLEQGFQDASEPYEVILYEAKRRAHDFGRFLHRRSGSGEILPIKAPNKWMPPDDGRPLILKLAGSVDPNDRDNDSFVVSEDDYIEYLANDLQLPSAIEAELSNSSLLFLGCGLRDWNVRLLLHRIWGTRQTLRLRSWAVVLDPSPTEAVLWAQRGVDLLDVGLTEYVERLMSEVSVLASGER